MKSLLNGKRLLVLQRSGSDRVLDDRRRGRRASSRAGRLLSCLCAVALPGLVAAPPAWSDALNPPPWWSEGATFIQSLGGVCSDRAFAVSESGQMVMGVTRSCSVTSSGHYSVCEGSRAGSTARFSCIIRGSAFVSCSRPGAVDRGGWVSDDNALFATLAECVASRPGPKAELGVRVELQPSFGSRGTVLVRVPGAPSFERLTGQRAVPPGTVVDVRKGSVYMLASRRPVGRGRSVHAASFSEGRFSIHQRRGSDGLVELRLTGSLSNCSGGGSGGARTVRGRRLTGEIAAASGLFRIRGRSASATATLSSTRWSVHDRCDRSTLVSARRKSVRVRDHVRMRDLRISAPRSYVARPRRR